jgi:hypothetical protein
MSFGGAFEVVEFEVVVFEAVRLKVVRSVAAGRLGGLRVEPFRPTRSATVSLPARRRPVRSTLACQR